MEVVKGMPVCRNRTSQPRLRLLRALGVPAQAWREPVAREDRSGGTGLPAYLMMEDNMQSTRVPRSDLDILADLNRDYIRSVQTSDLERFDQILSDDFYCSNPDGQYLVEPFEVRGLNRSDIV